LPKPVLRLPEFLGRRGPTSAGYSADVIDITDIENALETVSDEAPKRLLSQVIEALLAEVAELREDLQSSQDEIKRLKGLPARPVFGGGKGNDKDVKGSSDEDAGNKGSSDQGSSSKRRDKGGKGSSDKDAAKNDAGDKHPKGDAPILGPIVQPEASSTDISSEQERHSSNPWHKGFKAGFIVVHNEQYLDEPPPDLPSDVVDIGYLPHVVQDLLVVPYNTRFQQRGWYCASEHKTYLAPLPPGYKGDFGPGVRTLVPSLHFIANVSQPCIRKFVESAGVFISSGTVSNMLVKETGLFHAEFDSILRAGLESSPFQCTDHTSSPFNGELHQCQVLGNPCYTVYATTPSKSRRAIIQVLLNRAHSTTDGAADNKPLPTYLLDTRAYGYLSRQRCPRKIINALKELPQEVAFCEEEFHLLLAERIAPAIKKRVRGGEEVQQGLSALRFKQICDAAAIAFYHAQKDWPVVNTLLADGASTFEEITDNLALCWVHEGRLYKKLSPYLQQNRKALNRFLGRLWKFYGALLLYRQNPTPKIKRALSNGYDRLFSTVTGYDALDKRIAATLAKKKALLMVLDHPELPLHNNDSELAARARVRKRDVSLQNRTPEGARSWDIFMTLVATARKLGVNLSDYLRDRITKTNAMPSLASLITQRAATLKLAASWNTS